MSHIDSIYRYIIEDVGLFDELYRLKYVCINVYIKCNIYIYKYICIFLFKSSLIFICGK